MLTRDLNPSQDQESIDLLKRTTLMLAMANLRLHKFASNDPKATEAFPSSDRATNRCNLDLNKHTKHVQCFAGSLLGALASKPPKRRNH